MQIGFAVIDEPVRLGMSVAVYDFPHPLVSGSSRGMPGCDLINCSADWRAQHSVGAMAPWRRFYYFGPTSAKMVADGLPTQVMVDLLAHDVVRYGRTGLVSFQQEGHTDGDPDSFGGVLFEVPLPSQAGSRMDKSGGDDPPPVLRFVVSAAAADARDNHFVSSVVGDWIVRALLREGRVSLQATMGGTYIVGARLL
jgi:hypothetical protein